MLIEVESDVERGELYISSRLSKHGQQDYPRLLKEAVAKYDAAWLADMLRADNRLNVSEQRRKPKGGYTVAKVPISAPETLAEGEFNRFYIRALCRRAREDNISELIIYLAKDVSNVRPEAERLVGTTVSVDALFDKVKTATGIDSALGLPPGRTSGLSVRLP
ncbi:MAG TPA: hypothetical protein VGV59_08735 [Pyrinomonadaceae bacterium]|nr:hypothetical protein [Pyrinomonadaceae bacterium]